MLHGRGTLALAVLGVLAVSVPRATAQAQPPLAVVVDPYMMPASGAIDLLTAQQALTTVEDRWLPPRRFDESTPVTRTLGIAYRFAKWFGLDLPQDHFLMVVGHEVFGHGARLREVGASGIRYHFDAPIPYGGGGASTEFDGEVRVARADVLAVDTAGIEAQNAIADAIGRRALAGGALPYREAWLYLESRLAGLGYIRSVSPHSEPGHDVASFLLDLNDGCDPPACQPLRGSTLKRRALLMLADPLLAASVYGWAASYLVRGDTALVVPTIPLPRDIRYLPAIRFEMTPYGTEWTMEHNFAVDGRLTSVSVRIGDASGTRAWGVGVVADAIVRRERVTAGVTADLWRQPALDAPPNPKELATGALAMGIAKLALGHRAPVDRAGVYVQGGYKSAGFVRGERLHAGPILRVGITFSR